MPLTPKLLAAIAALYFGNSAVALADDSAATISSDMYQPKTKSPIKAFSDAWGLGASLGVAQHSDALKIEANTPAFATIGHSNLAAYADFGDLSFANVTVPNKTHLVSRDAAFGGLGLRFTQPDAHDLFQTYQRVGVMALSPSRDLIDKKGPLWGGELAVGMEKGLSPLLGKASGNSFDAAFVETSYQAGFGRADQQPGQPDLFNEFAVSVGYRTYF